MMMMMMIFWLPCFEHESKPKDEIHQRILDLCFGRCSFYIYIYSKMIQFCSQMLKDVWLTCHMTHDFDKKNERHIISIIYKFGTGIDWHAVSYTHILQWFYSPVGYQQEVRVPCEERRQQDLSKSPPILNETCLSWVSGDSDNRIDLIVSNHQLLLWFLQCRVM